MKQKPAGRVSSSEQTIRDIKRKTRKYYSARDLTPLIIRPISSDGYTWSHYRHSLDTGATSRSRGSSGSRTLGR